MRDSSRAPGRQLPVTLIAVDAVTVLGLLTAILWLIWKRTTQVPFADEWATTFLFKRWDEGTLSFYPFWRPHNVHRILVPRVIDFILISLTGYNRQIEMTFDLGVGLATLVLFLKCARRTFRDSEKVVLMLAPVLACLLLSPAQFENWLAPFQITFIATIFGVAMGAWGLYALPEGPKGFVLALAGVLISALSSFAGLAALFVFLPYLWFSSYRRPRYLGTWLFTTLGLVALYLHDLGLSSDQIADSVEPLRFFFTCLGAPIATTGYLVKSWAVGPAMLLGVLSLVLMSVNTVILLLMKESRRDLLIWICIALFAAASVAFLTLGRNIGIGAAMTPRYQAFSVLWWLSTFVLTALTTTRLLSMPLKRLTAGALVVANIAFIGVATAGLMRAGLSGLREGSHWQWELRQNQDCVRYFEFASDTCLRKYYPDVVALRDLARVLARHHFCVFRSEPARIVGGRAAVARIDRIGAVSIGDRKQIIRQLQGTPLTIYGWAIDPETRSLPERVFITMDGVDYALADNGFERKDVSNAYKQPAYLYSGFIAELETSGLTLGYHELGLRVDLANPESSYPMFHKIRLEVLPSVLSKLVLNKTPATFNIDVINGHHVEAYPEDLKIPAGQPFSLAGWAIDRLHQKAAGGVIALIDADREIHGDYGNDRSDVARAFAVPEYRYSGFSVTVPEDISPGRHALTLFVLTADLQSYYLPVQYEFKVGN